MIGSRFGVEAPQSVGGMKVYVSPDHPRMQLSERVKEVLTPAQIADHNEWMLRFFGTTNLLEDGQSLVSQIGGFVTMNPRTYENFKNAVRHG